MGITPSGETRYPQWESVWQGHLPAIDEHIVDYYNNSGTVPSSSELAISLRSMFETVPLPEDALAEFIKVRRDMRYLHSKVLQRVSHLFRTGQVSAGFLQHITTSQTIFSTDVSNWSPPATPASGINASAWTANQGSSIFAEAQVSFHHEETGMENLQLLATKYPRLMRAWEDSLTEIDREIDDVYRYTEDTAELAIDECKVRIEYLLECLPLDIQAHFELAGIRHESHLLRSKVEERVEQLAKAGRVRIPRSVANYFSPR